jgi:signal transduction histidine kinase
MSLQALGSRVTDGDAAHRLDEAIDELDGTIREIRNTIFALHTPSAGLQAQLTALIAELRERLMLSIDLRIDGPIDLAVPEPIAKHLAPVLREALTNVARHADAQRVEVDVRVDADVTVMVSDDGVGMPTARPDRGEGLTNLAVRAAAVHGTFTIDARPGGGTVLTWRAPLDD